MDPAIANQNLDPPRDRVLARGLIPALLVNVLVMGALAIGMDWKRGSDVPKPAPDAQVATASGDNDTSRMGASAAPASAAPVPAWPSAAVSATAPAPAVSAAAPSPAGATSPPRDADATLRPMGQAPAPAPAPVPQTRVEPRTQVASVTTRTAPRLAAEAAQPTAPADQRMQPSFDCAKARSPTERLICRDPQLSRMDRELGRVHAQAKRAAPDPADFKRENDEEWRLREAVCRDKDCLLEWYAHRRQQLQARIASAR